MICFYMLSAMSGDTVLSSIRNKLDLCCSGGIVPGAGFFRGDIALVVGLNLCCCYHCEVLL